MDLCYCLGVRRAARRLTRIYARHMAEIGLTSSQFGLLVLLFQNPGLGFKSMIAPMAMDRTSLVRAIKPLLRDGLLQADTDADDSRQLIFTVTPAGVELVKRGRMLWKNAQADLEMQIGQPAAHQFRALASQVADVE